MDLEFYIWCVNCVTTITILLLVFLQELKGKFLIKGKRLNKLDDAFNNSAVEDGTVSEEDEAADCKENNQKGKSKVC